MINKINRERSHNGNTVKPCTGRSRFPSQAFHAELAGRTLPCVRAITFSLVARTHCHGFARLVQKLTCQLLERRNLTGENLSSFVVREFSTRTRFPWRKKADVENVTVCTEVYTAKPTPITLPSSRMVQKKLEHRSTLSNAQPRYTVTRPGYPPATITDRNT